MHPRIVAGIEIVDGGHDLTDSLLTAPSSRAEHRPAKAYWTDARNNPTVLVTLDVAALKRTVGICAFWMIGATARAFGEKLNSSKIGHLVLQDQLLRMRAHEARIRRRLNRGR